MNASRQRQLLDGQTSVARKVFEGIPIQETWTEGEIITAIRAGTMSIAAHAVRACLLDMKDAGLVKEPRKGYYQRAPVVPKKDKESKADRSADSATIQPAASEATMKTLTLVPQAAATAPLDLLGTIATELTVFSTEFGERMKELSERVEDVALLIEAQREADQASMAKANQLQSLIKEMAGQL